MPFQRIASFPRRLPDLRRRAPALGMGVLYLYLAYHAFSGSQGLVSWMERADQAARLEVKLERLEIKRDALQADVDRLSAKSLDLDALDIEARKTLFVSRPEEITIWLDASAP